MAIEIPGYKIVRVLGKGGMATVYLAVQEIFEREVALKVMSKGLADDPAFGQRFLREARIVSQLVHPNIVAVYDVGVHKGAYFLSMEYIKGDDLKDAAPCLDFSEKVRAIIDIAKALDFAGTKGYVHRDIKPENIMLNPADGKAILMDFGIARAAETDIAVTQVGTAIGTPHYMSPEQAKGIAVDTRSDLYSLGVVFYHIVVGCVPYDGDSAVAIGIKHLTEPVPELPPQFSVIQYVLDRLMAKRPEERFQSGAEVIIAIDNLGLEDHFEQIEADIENSQKVEAVQQGAPTLVHDEFAYKKQDTQEDSARRFTLSFEAVEESAPNSILPRVLFIAASICILFLGVGFYFKFVLDESIDLDSIQKSDLVAALQNSVQELGKDAQYAKLAPEKQREVDSARDEITALRKRYKSDKRFLPELVQKYREIQVLLPENKHVTVAIAGLAMDSIGVAQERFNQGAFSEASALWQSYKTLFPDVDSVDAKAFDKRLKKKDKLETLMKRADSLLAKGRKSETKADDALVVYQNILSIDPNIKPAADGLKKLLNEMVGTAHKVYRKGQRKKAHQILKRVLSVDSTLEQGILLKKKFEQSEKKELAIQEHLGLARRYVKVEAYYAPKSKNAFEAYNAVLKLDSDNHAAKNGLKNLHTLAGDRAAKLVDEGAYEKARKSLEAASLYRSKEGEFQLLLLSIDEAIVAHKYQSGNVD